MCVIYVMKSSWESEAADLYSLFNDDESWWAQEGYMFIWMHKQSVRVNLSANKSAAVQQLEANMQSAQKH